MAKISFNADFGGKNPDDMTPEEKDALKRETERAAERQKNKKEASYQSARKKVKAKKEKEVSREEKVRRKRDGITYVPPEQRAKDAEAYRRRIAEGKTADEIAGLARQARTKGSGQRIEVKRDGGPSSLLDRVLGERIELQKGAFKTPPPVKTVRSGQAGVTTVASTISSVAKKLGQSVSGFFDDSERRRLLGRGQMPPVPIQPPRPQARPQNTPMAERGVLQYDPASGRVRVGLPEDLARLDKYRGAMSAEEATKTAHRKIAQTLNSARTMGRVVDRGVDLPPLKPAEKRQAAVALFNNTLEAMAGKGFNQERLASNVVARMVESGQVTPANAEKVVADLARSPQVNQIIRKAAKQLGTQMGKGGVQPIRKLNSPADTPARPRAPAPVGPFMPNAAGRAPVNMPIPTPERLAVRRTAYQVPAGTLAPLPDFRSYGAQAMPTIADGVTGVTGMRPPNFPSSGVTVSGTKGNPPQTPATQAQALVLQQPKGSPEIRSSVGSRMGGLTTFGGLGMALSDAMAQESLARGSMDRARAAYDVYMSLSPEERLERQDLAEVIQEGYDARDRAEQALREAHPEGLTSPLFNFDGR